MHGQGTGEYARAHTRAPPPRRSRLLPSQVVKKGKEADASMPFLLYLQGGPGYPSPRLGAPPDVVVLDSLADVGAVLRHLGLE